MVSHCNSRQAHCVAGSRLYKATDSRAQRIGHREWLDARSPRREPSQQRIQQRLLRRFVQLHMPLSGLQQRLHLLLPQLPQSTTAAHKLVHLRLVQVIAVAERFQQIGEVEFHDSRDSTGKPAGDIDGKPC